MVRDSQNFAAPAVFLHDAPQPHPIAMSRSSPDESQSGAVPPSHALI
jgi:hypothetical protein